ncbi:hypothetical protein [Escherichia phage pEC-N1203-2Af.1]|nr:hypothetical protein [Escherichia phage pEC-N1203-2Af.1]
MCRSHAYGHNLSDVLKPPESLAMRLFSFLR